MPQIVVVGSANADLVLDVPERPAAGQTVLGSDLVTTPGGKGANQAVAARRAGGDVGFVGCVGDDGHGAMVRASLVDAGVDVGALAVVDAPTGVAVIVVTPDGENAIVVAPGANRALTPARLAAAADHWARARVLVAQLEIPVPTVSVLARHATAGGARLVLNAAPVAAVPDDVLAACDPLVVNGSEARALLGAPHGGGDGPVDDGAALARALLARGPRSVVVTLGARGAVVAHGSTTTPVPAPRVRVVDTTGAGDAFVGALAALLAAGRPLTEAAGVAVGYAARTVTRRGAQVAYPPL